MFIPQSAVNLSVADSNRQTDKDNYYNLSHMRAEVEQCSYSRVTGNSDIQNGFKIRYCRTIIIVYLKYEDLLIVDS